VSLKKFIYYYKNDDFLGNCLGLLKGVSRESIIKLVENLIFDINNNNVSETGWIDKLYVLLFR
jgi:hypothetical protein